MMVPEVVTSITILGNVKTFHAKQLFEKLNEVNTPMFMYMNGMVKSLLEIIQMDQKGTTSIGSGIRD